MSYSVSVSVLADEDREKLESLNLIQDLADLEKKQKMAEAWVRALVAELNENI